MITLTTCSPSFTLFAVNLISDLQTMFFCLILTIF
jgi:hypothetical protein